MGIAYRLKEFVTVHGIWKSDLLLEGEREGVYFPTGGFRQFT
jgi:hypothetical protein